MRLGAIIRDENSRGRKNVGCKSKFSESAKTEKVVELEDYQQKTVKIKSKFQRIKAESSFFGLHIPCTYPLYRMSSTAAPTVPKKKLQELTQEEVGFLLTNLGLDKHVDTFKNFHVDGVVLGSLKSESDLSSELAIKSHVQRLNLISHIKDFTDQKGVPLNLLEPPLSTSEGRHRALSSLNVNEVGELMQRIELPNMKQIAEEFNLDGSMLSEVNDNDLQKELKVESR